MLEGFHTQPRHEKEKDAHTYIRSPLLSGIPILPVQSSVLDGFADVGGENGV